MEATALVAPFLGLRSTYNIAFRYGRRRDRLQPSQRQLLWVRWALTARGHMTSRYYLASQGVHKNYHILFCHVKNLLQLYCLSVMLSSSYSSFSSTHVSCDNYASFRNNCVSDDCFIFCLFYTMVHLKHLHLVDLQGSYTLSNGECV